MSIPAKQASHDLTLFLCGDVMLGRGIDQILPHPCRPHLYERWVRSALDYVRLAEKAAGPLRRPVDFSYVWGDAVPVLARMSPAARIVNLETAVTTNVEAWPEKGIHYRMHPENIPCLAAAGIDCCVLANNHVLDWGYRGLTETLSSLHRAGMATAGAGSDAAEASAPAVLEAPEGRVLIFAWCTEDSGVPPEWNAGPARPGVNLLPDLDERGLKIVADRIRAEKRPRDLVVVSLHWGGNWGYDIPAEQRRFAHALVDEADVDAVHGHSSHHVKGLEVYRGKPVLYGCGDFINDYEGIRGHEAFRASLALMYFPAFRHGRLTRMTMAPVQIRNLRVNHAPESDVAWLADTLNREGRTLGSRVIRENGQALRLEWKSGGRPS